MNEEITRRVVEPNVEILKGLAVKVDRILIEEIGNEEISCAFFEARILGVKSVGVQGDGSSYKYPAEITIKDPKKQDGTSYKQGELYEFLSRLSSRITNEIREINRVVYTIRTRDDETSAP